MTDLQVVSAGPSVTVQDAGWQGTLALGLSQGGVADRRAYAEAGALLGHAPGAVLEMAGMGVTLLARAACRIALTGAQMRVAIDGDAILWNATHQLNAGQTLTIGPVLRGVYGYLSFGGGLHSSKVMGSSSTHRASGLGQVIEAGDVLRLKDDPLPDRTGLALPAMTNSSTPLRLVPTAQTALFGQDVITAFESTCFTRSPRGNRQGVALESESSFTLKGGQSIVSETALPGDIQLPGDGTPVVLLADCQTTGGYPRLASILPCDLPRVVQAAPGEKLTFKLIDRQLGIAAEIAEDIARKALPQKVQPILRDPADMRDLLGYQLISGVTAGDEKGT